MGASVLPFVRALQRPSEWSTQELAEFYRVESALIQAGLRIETDRGVTDEGEPWFAFCRAEDGEVLVHIARLDGEYILAGPSYSGIARGRDIRSLVEDLVARHPLVRVDAKAEKRSNIFMHPAALLVAVVATAFFKSGEAHAMTDHHDAAPSKGAVLVGRGALGLLAPATPAVPADAHANSISVDAVQAAVVISAVLSVIDPLGGPESAPAPQLATMANVDSGAMPPGLAPSTHDGFSPATVASAVRSDTGFLLAESDVKAPAVVTATAHPQDASVETGTLSVIAVLNDLAKVVVTAAPTAALAPLHGDISNAPPVLQSADLVTGVPSASPERATLQLALGSNGGSSGLPKVIAASVLISDGVPSQLSPDQISHVAQLPDLLLSAVQNGAHTSVDLSQLPSVLTQAASQVNAALLHAGPASGSSPPSSGTAPSEGQGVPVHTTADLDQAIKTFIADTPNYKMVATDSDVVVYDAFALSHELTSVHSLTWTFQDGSSLSLVGLASTIHDINIHALVS